MEKKLTKKKPDLLTISSKNKFPNQRNSPKNPEFSKKKKDKAPLFDEIITPSIKTPQLFETPFEIKVIATALLFHVSNQKMVKLFSTFLKNVEKPFQPKHRSDPAIKLFQKFHDFLELFSGKKKRRNYPLIALMTTKSISNKKTWV